MKRNTFLNVLGYFLLILAFLSFVLAVGMETGKQFWIMTFISIGYLTCSAFVFNNRTTSNGPEGF